MVDSLSDLGLTEVTTLTSAENNLTYTYDGTWHFQFPTSYSRRLRPRINQLDHVTVFYMITITQLISLDEKQQEMATKVWIDQTWHDEFIKWDYTPQGTAMNQTNSNRTTTTTNNPCTGIDCSLNNTSGVNGSVVDRLLNTPQWLAFRPGEVWIPDIAIDNSISVERENFNIKVQYNGDMWWSMPAIVRTVCHIQTRKFPFDNQTCSIIVGSWYYPPDELNLEVTDNMTEMDVSHVINAQWNIVGSTILVHNTYHEEYSMVFRTIEFSVTFERKSLYYCLILIVPYILVSLVSFANFLLPSESGEKIALGVTVLLSQFVNLLNLVDLIPESSDSFPILGIYYLVSMGLVAFSIVLTVLVLNVHFNSRQTRRLPSCLHYVFLQKLRWIFLPGVAAITGETLTKSGGDKLGSFTNLNYSEKSERFASFPKTLTSFDSNHHCSGTTTTPSRSQPDFLPKVPQYRMPLSAFEENDDGRREEGRGEMHESLQTSKDVTLSLLAIVKDIRRLMERGMETHETSDYEESVLEEWRLFACIVDRIIGIIYIVSFASFYAFYR